MKFYGIYRITNTVTGEMYVGQSRGKCGIEGRWSRYRGGQSQKQPKIARSLKLYGVDAHRFEILQLMDRDDVDGINEAEMWWIAKLNTVFSGLNCHGGGNGVCEETRRKLSEANRGRVRSEDTRRKLSEASRNSARAARHRQRLADSRRGKPLSEEHRRKCVDQLGKIHENRRGKPLGEETRRKLSEAHRGKTLSEEHRRKVGEAGRGRVKSEETRRKLSESLRGRSFSKDHLRKISEAKRDLAREARIMARVALGHSKANIARDEEMSTRAVFAAIRRHRTVS